MAATTLYFNSWKKADCFARQLKRMTGAKNIMASVTRVTFPPEVAEAAKDLYLAFVHTLENQRVNIGAFAGAVLTLLGGDPRTLPEAHPVLQAFRRSDSSLADASAADIAAYLQSFPLPEQIAGVINNVKGIYHEQRFVELENGDGDFLFAEIMPLTNHPGTDVLLTNSVTGAVVELQLKATNSVAYVKAHLDQYPDIAVAATSEVAAKIPGVIDSGLSNHHMNLELEEAVELLQGGSVTHTVTDLAGDMFQASIIGALVSEGINAASAIKGGRAVSIDTSRLISVGKRAAALALVTGIIW